MPASRRAESVSEDLGMRIQRLEAEITLAQYLRHVIWSLWGNLAVARKFC